MSRLSRSLALVAGLAIATSAMAGCTGAQPRSSSPGSSGPAATDPTDSAATGSGILSNLPDLDLRNVRTETAAARGSVITAAGGTITATGTNGAVYTLSIPRDAVPSTTQIAIYPISSATNLPGGAAVSAGVQITPDGIQLRRPATFTIQLPAGIATAGLGGLLWTGDAEKAHAYPMSVDGQTVTMHLFHFTAPGVTPNALPLVPLVTCTTEFELEAAIGYDATITNPTLLRNTLTDALRECYDGYVAPRLQDALAHLDDDFLVGQGITAYSQWIYALADAASAVGSQSFTVSPETADAKTTAIALAKAMYKADNDACVAHKDDPDLGVPIRDAFGAMTRQEVAHDWGIDTQANGLDLETALDNLCVQVVIDPSRSYAATEPGTTGAVNVTARISIAGGPLRASGIHVTLGWTATGNAAAGGTTDSSGNFTENVPWLVGVDPMQIDILAELLLPGTDIVTPIARFDRITKHLGGKGPVITLPPPTGTLKLVISAKSNSGFGQGKPLDLPVVGACQSFLLVVTDAHGKPYGNVEKVTMSGQAKAAASGAAGGSTTSAAGPFTVTVSGRLIDTIFSGGRSFYTDALSGQYTPAGGGLPQVFVQGLLDSEGHLSYEVRYLTEPGLDDPANDWHLVADGNRLHGVGPSTTPLDVTIDGAHLRGTIGDTSVDLLRDWAC